MPKSVNGTKICSSGGFCKNKQPQPLENFGKDTRTKDGLCNSCKVCCRAKAARWRKKTIEDNPQYERIHWLKKYGLTLDRFNEMLVKQKNKCGGCQKQFTEDNKPFIHHHHVTGDVVALWHRDCNFAEGMMRTPTVAYNIFKAMESEALFYFREEQTA